MPASTRTEQLAAALSGAFARREFSFEFQPQVDLRDGTVTGLEVLLRWHSPEFGSVSPAEFVPLAEVSGLLVEIGEWLFGEVCRQSVAWARAGLPALRIAVNIGAVQLARPDFAQRLQAMLLATGADPHNLGIEVAEAVLTRDIVHSRRVLQELRAIGMEVALDNFGTSASSLSVLRSLPLDVLKIDRSLVHDVTAAPEDVSVTRAVLMLAKGLKLRVLAEGVETEGQLRLLIANGCEVMQGYVFSPPVPAAAIEQMLRDGRRLPEPVFSRGARQRTLLIVDDEENVVSSLRRLLRGAGYRILTAASGAEGLARLAEHDVDVIVSDQRMPGMTGVEMLQQAKVLYPDTVRIVLSGYTGLQSITDAVNEGAIYKFLTKPWDDDRLRVHIAEAFMRKEMSDENRRLAADLQLANVELAAANERQRGELAARQQQTGLDARGDINAQHLLECLPSSAIGIDEDGTVVFVNRQARLLMGADRPLVGGAAEDVLPAHWRAAWHRPDGSHHRIAIDGVRYLLSCAAIADRHAARGHLLSIVPDLETCARSLHEPRHPLEHEPYAEPRHEPRH